MKKLITLMATFLLIGTFSLSAQTVAVFDFDCDDYAFYDKVGTMTDLLCHELVQNGNITLVERKNLQYVKDEMKFQMEGWTDPETVKQAGKMLNADCIIVGSVATLGCPLYIIARMIEVETGKVLHSAKMSLDVWSDYEKQLPKFAKDCVDKMPTPDYFVGTWQTSVSTENADYDYEITLQENGKCSVKVTTYNLAGNEVTQTANGTYSHDKDFFRLSANFRGVTIENIKKLDWKSVYVFDGNKTSFNILVPADNTSTSSNIRITLVKVE